MRRVSFGLILVLAILGCSATKADTIGTLILTNCGSGGTGCPAGTYSFDISKTSATLQIKVTGPTTSKNDYIGSVNLGFTPSGTINNLILTAAPSALRNWTSSTGSLNSNGNGCGTNAGAFVCATALPSNPLLISQGGTYTWTWAFTDPPGPVTGTNGDGVHIGTQYGPNSGNWKGLIVSQTAPTAPVPEPASIVLLGSGLLAVGAFAQRRLKKA